MSGAFLCLNPIEKLTIIEEIESGELGPIAAAFNSPRILLGNPEVRKILFANIPNF